MAIETRRAAYIEACKLKAAVEAELLFDSQLVELQDPEPTDAKDVDNWLTVDQAAEYSKYKKRTIQDACRSGELKSHGTGKGRRIAISAIDRWLRDRKK